MARYWLHRAQHAVPLLWRFHRMHHSIRDMSAWNSLHHVAEEFQQSLLVVLPTTFLVRVDQGALPWIVLFVVGFHAFFQHSSTRFHLGPVGYMICDNRYHRVHHSLSEEHHNKNFGTVSPIWDVLFGTAHFPAKGEWPETGLRDVREPLRIVDYLAMPFRPLSPP